MVKRSRFSLICKSERRKYLMDNKQQLYDKEYYQSHCGTEYIYNDEWKQFWGNVADEIVRTLHPKTVLDVGCAKGFLVYELRKRNVEAYGIDISQYAISQVDDSIKNYCRVGSALESIKDHYDLITCIEVVEHLNHADSKCAIKNMCAATDDILFSSTPFDYEEKTHIGIKPIEDWIREFYYHGFLHNINYDATFISVQAVYLRKEKKECVDLISDYERKYFSNLNELFHVRLLANNLDLENKTLMQQCEKDIAKIKKENEENMERVRLEMTRLVREEEKHKIAYFDIEKEKNSYVNENKVLKEKVKKQQQEFEHAIEIIKYNEQMMEQKDNEKERLANEFKDTFCWKITSPIRMLGKILGR